MKKFLLIVILSLNLFALPRVFVWDNDLGNTFIDPETNTRVGCETNIINALKSLGITPEVGTVLPNLDSLIQSYDILFIVNGWNQGDIIGALERKNIGAFLDTGNCVYLEGNSMAEVYTDVDPTFLGYFGTKFISQGNPNGNVDTLIGASGSIADGLKFAYPYNTVADSSIDEVDISDRTVDTLFLSPVRGKILVARGSAWDKQASKSTKYKTIFISYEFGALQSSDRELTPDSTARKILMERYLAFFGYATTLLVDDDGENTYNDILEEDLESLNIDYSAYTVRAGDNNGPSFSLMSNYHNVIWLTAREKTWTLTPTDTANIANYLKSGGRVFLIGENIASDMHNHYKEVGDTFMLKWFKTYAVRDSVDAIGVRGMGIAAGRSSYLKGNIAPDLLEISKNGDTLAIYTLAKADAPGGVSSDSAGIKTSIIAYNYGDMTSTTDRQGLLQDVLTFFGYSSPVAVQISAFSCNLTSSGVLISFRAENSVDVRHWNIERKNNTENKWLKIASLISSQSALPENIVYLDKDVKVGKYTYRVGAETEEGIKWLSYETITVRNISENTLSFSNIFSKYVIIPLRGKDTVEIFDLAGRKIDTIEGKDRVVWHPEDVNAGIYLFKTKIGKNKGKIIFIK